MNVKVMFHIDESTKWNLLLRNVQNLIQTVETDTSKIEVLANSEALKFYLKSNKENSFSVMQELSGRGSSFCGM